MLLYLVEPESSRTLCCKVDKWIDVVFRGVFYRECFEECSISEEVREYVFTGVTKVACKVWRKPCLIKCDGGQTVIYKPSVCLLRSFVKSFLRPLE